MNQTPEFDKPKEHHHDCFHYCCWCRKNISYEGWHGHGLDNVLTYQKHYYCHECYPRVAECYVADLNIKKAENQK
jgi:hypothetical protein